jgi:branched-subunit amino acid transport protein
MREVTIVFRLWRFALVQVLQVPLILLALLGAWPWALFTAALIGSVVCAGGTDSAVGPGATLARWLNRMLVLEAILWLTFALIFALPF